MEPKFKIGDRVKLNKKGKKEGFQGRDGIVVEVVKKEDTAFKPKRPFYYNTNNDVNGHCGTWEEYLKLDKGL